MSELSTMILDRIRDIPDYPKPGVLFKDITPLLADPVAMAAVVDELAGLYQVDKIVGIEARGFILAAPVAYRAGAGFVPVRKKGKLPAETLEESYDLEYGSATIEVHRDAFAPGERALIVDDVLATGGTAKAAVDLVERAGAEVVGIAVLMELAFLKGRDRLPGVELHSLVIV
ncbi:adenine phosphoribosyltransferase [Nonomuraea turkmeniaca]|uniref:Adenine phosphoribosyltransferase n=1 Tax=Nonomuraea turkmeniaca TaxID=103838 RepID=A0A5S4FV63_9ACTN|nr:adenine phosphoribosyltransferase [Nonomuraea turkmeniaca]TMR24548.1 adenine phosphoribosyltransferase [Nonomuraea turkmeniaca]